jgi:DNA polymerase I
MTNEANIITPKLVLVDGHAQAYRAFYAIRSLKSPLGKPTNAIFGFVKILERLLEWLQPTHLAVIWDGGLAEERLALLPEYKAQRPPMPGELAEQLDEIQAYLKAAGVASVCLPNTEADDLIATIVRGSVSWAKQVVIASADKDFMQLVNDQVGLANPNDKPPVIWTAAEVEKKAGVKPQQVVDWLSLMGDSVDNIPGVEGIGPKTAAKLIKQFGTADALYDRLNEVGSEMFRKKLEQAEASVKRNRLMIRLKDDLEFAGGAEVFCRRSPAKDELLALYRQWGFKGMSKALETVGIRSLEQQTEFSL